jgi:hypothetical protein
MSLVRGGESFLSPFSFSPPTRHLIIISILSRLQRDRRPYPLAGVDRSKPLVLPRGAPPLPPCLLAPIPIPIPIA